VKITFAITGTVEYVGDITMTKKEYDEWCDNFDHSIGFANEKLCANLIEKAGLDLGDPSDWGSLQLDTFEPVRSARDRT
jgi:hypothetical protein